MSITVLRPGLLTTVQDLGRPGFQKYGVIQSGAMDSYSVRIANILVGNEEGEAVLEMTATGPTLRVEEDLLLAITGGDLSPTIDKIPLPQWKPTLVKKGSIIEFGRCRLGLRAYLAVAGGFSIDKIMGSRSTYLKAGIGGYKGRALKAGDHLATREQSTQSRVITTAIVKSRNKQIQWFVHLPSWLRKTERKTIRVLQGTHYPLFEKEAQETFFRESFQITNQSDRMGYRLSGPEIKLSDRTEMISEAVTCGTIQVPANGEPIILLADCQTIGGYPRIAQVLFVDLPLIAQAKPGDQIQFEMVDILEAERLYLKFEQDIQTLKVGLALKISDKLE